MSFNTQHAQDVLDYIETHPKQHGQSRWVGSKSWVNVEVNQEDFCGTTMCIAGTSVFLNEGNAGLFHYNYRPGDISYWFANQDIPAKAEEYLGLSREQAFELFYQMNNADALALLRCVAAGDEKKFNEVVDTQLQSP